MSNESNVPQLQAILKTNTGKPFSYAEAYEFGSELVEFLELLAEPTIGQDAQREER